MTRLCINGVDWQVEAQPNGSVAVKNTTGLSVVLAGPVANLLGTIISRTAQEAMHNLMSSALVTTNLAGPLYP